MLVRLVGNKVCLFNYAMHVFESSEWQDIGAHMQCLSSWKLLIRNKSGKTRERQLSCSTVQANGRGSHLQPRPRCVAWCLSRTTIERAWGGQLKDCCSFTITVIHTFCFYKLDLLILSCMPVISAQPNTWCYCCRARPGGRLRPGENEIDGLKRKLTSKLGSDYKELQVDWEIGDLCAVWWRPNFDNLQVLTKRSIEHNDDAHACLLCFLRMR